MSTLRTYKPLRSRSRLAQHAKSKPCPPKPGRAVRLEPGEIGKLRSKAYERSGGRCECWRCEPGKTEADWCGKRVTWGSGEMHHITPRSRGGADVLENVAFVTEGHHEDQHGKPQWGGRA